MATRITKTAVAGPVGRRDRRKLWRGMIFLALLLLLAGGGVGAVWWCKDELSTRNPRFTLHKVDIQSSGYWGKNAETRNALTRHLRLVVGVDNIFNCNLVILRKKLEAVPNIAAVEVERRLPDTLQLRIEERIPRAFLGYRNSGNVVDANCKVMSARECFGVDENLPFIVGVKDTITPGSTLESVRPALAVVMNIKRAFPEFTVVWLSISQADQLKFSLVYRKPGFRPLTYNVTMPVDDILTNLDILRNNIENAIRTRNPQREVDLLNAGSVIMR